MKAFVSLILVYLFLLPGYVSAQQKAVHPEIATVLEAIKDFEKRERAADSSRGFVLGSHTEPAYQRKYTFYKKANDQVKAINKNALSFGDQINLELLQHRLLDELANYQFKSYLNPILSDEGFHTRLVYRTRAILKTKKEAENYLTLLRDIPRYVEEHLQLMRKGLAAGISQPKIILKGYENTYTQHLVDSVEKSVFWQPFAVKPTGIPEPDWQRLQNTARQVIKQEVIGSFQKIKTFFDQEYLPKTRTTLGASHFPQGKAFYEDRVRHYTTTSLTSEEVYQIGLQEVARLQAEMHKVMQQVNFKGSFQEFVTFLRIDPKFYPKTELELLKEASYIAKKIDGKLPSLFGKLPRQPYSVAPVPAYLAPTYTTGRYSGSTKEYYVNTYTLPSRSLYTLEALTLHEAVPGHHLQISLNQELDHLPAFRRNLYINAFGEGWGLYSEYLGQEMGLYQDPYSLFGRLTYDMWRACRLVIDVGLHTKNWTREQAVAYLADHTALSLHEVNTEVNRYISWPGQALAYKIGELKIIEMRRKAEAALKEDFDVRAFHDMVLSNGSVTLAILEKMTHRFIQDQLKKKKGS
ncbi:DUF885 domain-containing protein [Rufibacter tibetensis]|uniref:DUF885 domain-containing protein n=1 Tax=Rufibacter tibetensis TaxID=512763 RepID=A0A0P0CU56_9BACT|nr:DUF885 domain-containing protein [Rufibacter tibetensis]ALI98806.1 hypothetical protein DC20_07245 [Rufibacter tibetensis]